MPASDRILRIARRKDFTMLLMNWLRVSATSRRIAAWAVEIAQRCQADVAARLSPAALRMSKPEACGYIRARAAAVLDQEMLLLADHLAGNLSLELAVRQQAGDEIVRMTLGDLLKAARPQIARKAA
jgi:hypothetical protein